MSKMPMSITDLKNAFREVVSEEFAHIPTDENSIVFTFSERFNKRMEKLIKSQQKIYYSFINTAFKRVAILCIIILTMLTTAFSVKAIREPIIKFIKQIYETFTHYAFEGDTKEIITKEYVITQLPDGFEQTYETKSENLISKTYQNASGTTIQFTQQATKNNTGLYNDNENTVISKQTVNGIEIEFQEWYDIKCALWVKDGYFFKIDCYGDIDFDTIKKLIASIE